VTVAKPETSAGKRHTAREMAVQMLYQLDLGGSPLAQVFDHFDLADYLGREGGGRDGGGRVGGGRAGGRAVDPEKVRRRVREAFDHARALVEGTLAHREAIDELIRGQADNWRLERMPAVDRNILRLAVFELLEKTAAPAVVIDEALEVGRRYSGDESAPFLNGILDAVEKSLGSEHGKAVESQATNS
jgi:N utilization substance protein B